MPRTIDAIAEANQRCRDLRNRLHEAEQKLQPLREQLRVAQAECERALAEAGRLARRATVLQQFVTAFIEMTHELASDKT
jgi:chromosome segregation ATPase